ncbi:hypothetical protein H4R18_003811 [Coemansia javaensis]|uniref:Monopolin complex subunit Csm1/Pcs1 C-terminal domain-containing protein n=1 Tax=Coemansia javaensis TaxID=2761396 RepID=A0A9W8H5Y5_9FUNG|nr:hypothetical protein H4R18_003811 [Coemansia javaensis]
MPPRGLRRTAAAAAKSAIAAENAEWADLEPARAGKAAAQPKPAARPIGRPRGSGKKQQQEQEQKQQRTPVRRQPAKPEVVVDVAPPDTVGAARRTRPRMGGAPAKPAVRTRRSPRKAKAAPPAKDVAEPSGDWAATPTPVEADDHSAQPEFVLGQPVDESGSESDMPLAIAMATPTKQRSGPAPMLVAHTPKSVRRGTAPGIEDSPSPKPKPALVRRGQKRKPDLTVHVPTTKRSRSDADVFVDIVSPSRFEASRALIREGRQRPAAPPAPADADGADGGWRAKYEELLILRQSQPEREYAEFRARAQERFDAAEEVVTNLRNELAELKRLRASEAAAAAAPAPAGPAEETAESHAQRAAAKELEKQIAQLREQVEALTQDILVKDEAIERLEKHRRLTETSTDYNLRQKLRVMEEVTGLVIEDLVAEDDGLSYICKQSAGADAGSAPPGAGYVLTVFDDLPNDYQYTPFGDAAALAQLPGYLQEPISFERTSANMFYWRMCSHLHQLRLGAEAPAPPSEGT